MFRIKYLAALSQYGEKLFAAAAQESHQNYHSLIFELYERLVFHCFRLTNILVESISTLVLLKVSNFNFVWRRENH